jgi:ATP-dependent RNA helicase RhlE
MSAESFADLGVSTPVANCLAAAGITQPFPIQRAVIGDALGGRDVIAMSPTGSGKTLAFGLPIVDRINATDPRPAALVLAPTRELAIQIVGDIRGIAHARALRVTAVYGGAGLVKQSREAAQAHILVATPGRLEDLLARGAFRLGRIRMLVLDEADRMLDMGFRPAIDRIVGACPPARQTLFFSATLDGEAGRLASSYADDPVTHRLSPPARQADAKIEHRFVATTHEHRLEALIDELRRERDLTLVFVRTKHGADRLVKRLAGNGIEAAAMHGNKSQRQRERALAQFESGKIDTLVATDVAARGIDVDRISHVINFDPPGDRETYVHRVGRTGRAGRRGIGITLLSADQHREVVSFAEQLGIDHGLAGRHPRSDAGRHPRSDGEQAVRSGRPPRASRDGAGRPTGAGSGSGSNAGTPRPSRRRRRPARLG